MTREQLALADEVDRIVDQLRTIDLAVLGLSESGGTGPSDFRALRTAVMEVTARVEALPKLEVPR